MALFDGFESSAGQSGPRGLSHIIVLKPTVIGGRVCQPGDIVKVEKVAGTIMPIDERLDERRAQLLVEQGRAKLHKLGPNDKVVSVVSEKPQKLPTPAEIEAATLTPASRGAQQAVTQRQKAGGAV